MASSDGGRTWAPQPGPPLTVLSWSGDGALVGADAEGTVYRGDGGDLSAWAPVGSRLPGEPQAVLGHGRTVYAAILDHMGTTAIYRLAAGPGDAPKGWDLLYRDA